MSGSHQADIQLRSLPLKRSLSSHTVYMTPSHNHHLSHGNKFNIASGNKRSLPWDNMGAMPPLAHPMVTLLSRTWCLLVLRYLANLMSRLQALHHPLTHTSCLRQLHLLSYPTSQLQSYMPSHTLRAQALWYPPDHRSQSQHLAHLFRLPNITHLHRAPFLQLKRTQRLLSTTLNHIRHP